MVAARADQCLAAYVEDPTRIEEDSQDASAEGGYGRKQIHELVQNAADAMRRAPGTIEVRLTDDVLYVANEGEPFSEAGVVALLYSHLSRKADDQIGRFGLGFKSVTAISSSPQIFSRSGSFGFDKARSERSPSSSPPRRRSDVHGPRSRRCSTGRASSFRRRASISPTRTSPVRQTQPRRHPAVPWRTRTGGSATRPSSSGTRRSSSVLDHGCLGLRAGRDWTLLGYFNSLRVLGGSYMQVIDDVPDL
ncbi:sacsin N-terminal ATP-binding-like domain-containing protein [Georgenia sp. SUBG003]|uniref:sacsin N-terminal ATP-binding-like domain-containing protein n=1 Tax=Georgenia sp. SUBG003 TaxID=1497974 RepID=UPI003AB74594